VTRRLLQVWAVLVLTTLVCVMGGGVLLVALTDSDARVIEHNLQGGVRSAVAELDATTDVEGTRARLEDRFGYPIVLTVEPPPRPVHYFEDAVGNGFVEAPLARGGGLRMGPLPAFELPPAEHFAPILLAVFLLSGIVSALVLLPQVRLVRSFEATVAQLGEGDWGARVGTEVPTYARSLAIAFDRMAGEIEDHIAARRRLLQVVSHELRTPLSRVQFGVDLLVDASDRADPTALSTHARALGRDIDELDALVEELQEFVRLERPRAPQPEDLDLVEALLDIADARRLDDQVRIRLPDLGDDATVHADPRQFARAVGNLVSNALRHAQATVELRAAPGPDGWTISVDDDGPGVPESARERIWRPFERAVDAEVRGSGLGLAIVFRIVTDHGGTVGVFDSPLGGARFTTTWPYRS